MLESLLPLSEFPLTDRSVGREGQRLVYLDSAASSLVPNRVLEAVKSYYHTSCSNIHRGAHQLAEESTDAFESTREQVAAFLGVGKARQIIFTHGSTESLNMAACCWAAHALHVGDTIVVSEDNHHANIVPWQMLSHKHGFKLRWIPLTSKGLLDYDAWHRLQDQRPKLVALTHCSNVLGYEQPELTRIIRDARQLGAKVVLDAAQSVGHVPFSLSEYEADFLAFSAHKMLGLTGLGVLACSPDVLEEMIPVYGGGGMIERVERDHFVSSEAPHAFEPGTPAIASVVALSEALRILEEVGLDALASHTTALCEMLYSGLCAIPHITVLGNRELQHTSLVTFTFKGVHPHDVSQMLSDRGITLRAGHHCAMPLHHALRVPASIRASVGAYSSEADIVALHTALAEIAREAA